MKWIYYVIAVGLSICAFYYTFKNVPFVDIWSYSKSIDYSWVILSMGINYISFLIRAYRWKIIVNQIYPLKFCTAYHLTSITFMMNSLLPGRMGELARPVILNQQKNIPVASGLTTIVSERLFDITILCLLFLGVIMIVDVDPKYKMNIGTYTLSIDLLTSIAVNIFSGGLILILCIICFNIDCVRSFITKCLIKLPQLFSFTGTRIQTFIERKCIHSIIVNIRHLSEGFSILKRPSAVCQCFIHSLTLWILIAVSNYVMTFGCKNLDISLFEMTAVLVIICFFISLPSVPGSWGLWEAGGIFALTIFGIGRHEAIGFTIVNHASQLLPVIVAGLVSVMITGISVRNSSKYPVAKLSTKE